MVRKISFMVAACLVSNIAFAQPAAPPVGPETSFLRELDGAYGKNDWRNLASKFSRTVLLTVNGRTIATDVDGLVTYNKELRRDGVSIGSASASVSTSFIFSIDRVILEDVNVSKKYGGCCSGSRNVVYTLDASGLATRVDIVTDPHGFSYPNTP